MRHLEKLYTSKNGTNVILKYHTEETTYYFLQVFRRGKDGYVNRVSFEFMGDAIRKSVTGEEKAMFLCLKDLIEMHGAFRLERPPYTTRNGEGKSAVTALAELTHGVSKDVRLANTNVGNFSFNPEIRTLIPLYNCTWSGFKGNGLPSPEKNNSCVFCWDSYMGITCDFGEYLTDRDDYFLWLLSTLDWRVKNGSLYGRVSPHGDEFSFGEIVFSFNHGCLFGYEKDVYSALMRVRQHFRELKLEVDHLTENKENNFAFALVALPEDIHAKFKNFRTRIKEPYFFLMAYDWKRRKIKVSCGMKDVVEKRFIFNNHEDRGAMELLGKCFEDFKTLVQSAGCFMKKPGRDSLLYREGMPEKAAEEGSLLEMLAKAPEESFMSYSPGEFDGLPVVSE